MKPLEEIKIDLETQMRTTVVIENGALVVPTEKIQVVAKFLTNSPDYELNYLSSVTGTDYKDRLEVVYHLCSMTKREGPLVLKVRTDREKSKVPSVTPVWRGAEFQEREIFDLFGIEFETHPDLRRILLWDEFEHYPMRKDYAAADPNDLI